MNIFFEKGPCGNLHFSATQQISYDSYRLASLSLSFLGADSTARARLGYLFNGFQKFQIMMFLNMVLKFVRVVKFFDLT